MTDDTEVTHVIVPYDKLSEDVLGSLIEDFILHESANHGAEETALDAKVAQVMKQLESGQVSIVYDIAEEHARIVPTHTLPKMDA